MIWLEKTRYGWIEEQHVRQVELKKEQIQVDKYGPQEKIPIIFGGYSTRDSC